MHKTFMFLASYVVALTLVGSVATGGVVFLDDFEDGSATDGAPVTWSPMPGWTGSFEVVDGDYVLTRPRDSEEMYSTVNQNALGDTSVRTQGRLNGPSASWFGLFARVSLTPQTAYIALLRSNGNFEIWLFGPSSAMLASARVPIDPRVQDVLLRFDVIGNRLSAWAWREGDPMPTDPQVTAVHSGLTSGFVGLAGDLGNRLSDSEAIFRYVEVCKPIPPSPDFNGDGMVDIQDLLRLIESWGQNDPAVDIAPPPFGDGVVDKKDLEVLMGYWGQEIPDPALVAHWKLDEAEGVVAVDSAGANDGVLLGNPTWQPTGGKLGGALQLDGVGDCVTTQFVRDPSEGPFSVFAWVKGGAPGQVILSQAGGANWLMAGASDGSLVTELKSSGRTAKALKSAVSITDGAWHRIGLVWDGSNRILYVDDIEVASDVQAGLAGTYKGLNFGAGSTLAPASFWSGMIDDVRIYNRAVKP